MPFPTMADGTLPRDDAVIETSNNFTKTPPGIQQPLNDELSMEDNSNVEERDASEEERRQAQEEESLALARSLMAEEAMASYHQSFEILRQSANQLSQEDYDMLQSVLEEEQHGQVEDLEDNQGNLSYETMLELGERIGDVKTERWALKADKVIRQLTPFQFKPTTKIGSEVDDSEHKCLVCQCEYEKNDLLYRLPCGHCFHTECVGHWLKTKDTCPYCRQSVVEENSS